MKIVLTEWSIKSNLAAGVGAEGPPGGQRWMARGATHKGVKLMTHYCPQWMEAAARPR